MEEQFNKLLLAWAKENTHQLMLDTEFIIDYSDDIVAVQNAMRTLHGWLCTITYYKPGQAGSYTEEVEIPVEYLLGWTWEKAGCIF